MSEFTTVLTTIAHFPCIPSNIESHSVQIATIRLNRDNLYVGLNWLVCIFEGEKKLVT